MKVPIRVDETLTVTLDSRDGVPIVIIERREQDGVVTIREHPLSHETVNLVRRWTEDAYPRGQER